MYEPYVCLNTPGVSGVSEVAAAAADDGVGNGNGDRIKTVNRLAAVEASVLATGIFALQVANPVSGVTLLRAMEADSLPVASAICNGKPATIDFYADWCESCKAMAPTTRALEVTYGDKVNFIALDGTKPRNAGVVDTFRVDGIPHVALLGADTELKTLLVGALPRQVVEQDIVALASQAPLPYQGANPFEGDSHFVLGDAQATYCKSADSGSSATACGRESMKDVFDKCTFQIMNMLSNK